MAKPRKPVTRPVGFSAAFAPRKRSILAKYDAAQTTPENRRHWINADEFSAAQALTPGVRLKLRTRSRYEVQNNSYASGILQTLANDTVGRGPRLQMLGLTPEDSRRVEAAFQQWASVSGLAEKLRIMRFAKAQDGEAFGQLITNESPMWGSPVWLDLRLVECDRIAALPRLAMLSDQLSDGIEYDKDENPISYNVLIVHPGDGTSFGGEGSITRSAADMLHYWRPDRPGQLRGVPDITPAIPLFAQLRRFTLAVLAAAETAADYAAVLQTDAPPSGEADAEVAAGEVYPLEKRTMTVLPAGWKLGQIETQQPATTYEMFKREILNEIARCLNMPYNVAAANSSSYNYASGRLDHQVYWKSLRVEQARVEAMVLDPLFARWIEEAKLVEGLLPQALRVEAGPDPLDTRAAHQWYWDGMEHVDPSKEANAQEVRLRNHTTTLAREFGRIGLDWEDELLQRKVELDLMNELGIPITVAPPGGGGFGGDRD